MYENRRRGIRYRIGYETVVVHSRDAGKSNGCGSDVVLILRVESQVERIWNLVLEDYRALAAIFKRSAAADDSSLEVRKCLVAGNRHRNNKLGQGINRDPCEADRDCRRLPRVGVRKYHIADNRTWQRYLRREAVVVRRRNRCYRNNRRTDSVILLGVEPECHGRRHRAGVVEHPFLKLKKLRIICEIHLKRRKLFGRGDRKCHIEFAFSVHRDIAERHRDNRGNKRVRIMYENRRRGISYRIGYETVVVDGRDAGKANGCGSDVVLILRVECQIERIGNRSIEDNWILAAILKRSAAADDHRLEVRKRLVARYRYRHDKLGERIDRDSCETDRDCRRLPRIRVRKYHIADNRTRQRYLRREAVVVRRRNGRYRNRS